MSKSSSSAATPTGSAGALTLVVDLGGSDGSVSYSVLGYTSSSTSAAARGGGGGAAKAVQRIYTTPRSSLLHPQDCALDTTTATASAGNVTSLLQSSPSSVWGPLREVLSIDRPKQAAAPVTATTTGSGGTKAHLTRMSVRSMIGAVLGDSLVHDEAHALHLVKMNNAATATASKAGGSGAEEGTAGQQGVDQSQVSLSSSGSSATTTREAVEALAARFKLLPLTATEVAVSEEPSIRSHINARIAKVSSDTSNVELASLASLAVLAPPQLSSLSTTSSSKHPFYDVSVLVLLPNDPTTTPRIMREAILAAIFSLDSVLLGSSSTSSSSSSASQIADLVSRRFFKLPMRVSKVQYAYSAVASLNACGLHSGMVCHIDVIGGVKSPSSSVAVSLCAVSNAQPVLPLCRIVPLTSDLTDLTGATITSAIRKVAKDFAMQIQHEISLDVPAVHCSKLPTSTTPSTPVVHPLAHSQNTTGVDASSLKDVAKHFVVKVSGGAVHAALGQEFANAFTAATRGDHLIHQQLGSKRQREDDEGTTTTTTTTRSEDILSFLIPASSAANHISWHPKEVIATTVPTLIEMVGVEKSSPTTASLPTTTSSSQGDHHHVVTPHRPVIASNAIQPVDRISISGIIGGTVLVQLPAFETYFTVTAPQYKVEGPAVSIARVPLDSR